MAIAPSKLGCFVVDNGFQWDAKEPNPPIDHEPGDSALARRLKHVGLVGLEVPDEALTAIFAAVRAEHAAAGHSIFNSPNERVRVFLAPHLTDKGRLWAVPLESMRLPDDDAPGQ